MTREDRMVAAHKFGRQDARAGHAEGAPVHPCADYELEAYRAGYHAERKRMTQEVMRPKSNWTSQT